MTKHSISREARRDVYPVHRATCTLSLLTVYTNITLDVCRVSITKLFVDVLHD